MDIYNSLFILSFYALFFFAIGIISYAAGLICFKLMYPHKTIRQIMREFDND